MRPVLLIARNFVREQRWLTVVLVLYAVGGAAVFGAFERHLSQEDVLFFVHQQSFYSVVFSFFLAASALHNERKSRRILAVLSKAVTRREYLAGLLAGILAVLGMYCLTIGISGVWLVRNARTSYAELWIPLGLMAVVSLLVSALALFFTTFLTPLFATAGTAATLAGAAALARALGGGWRYLLPVYSLGGQVAHSSATGRSRLDGLMIVAALAETLVLWALASWIFAGRDISSAVE